MRYYLHHLFVLPLLAGIFLKSFEFVYWAARIPRLGNDILTDVGLVLILVVYAIKLTAMIYGILWFVGANLNRLVTR